MFETKPEVLRIIEDAERANPSPGPYRIHRMPIWDPMGWIDDGVEGSRFRDRPWEHDTIQPKYGINLGVEYTHTLGVAELYDYDWYFNGFPWTSARPASGRVPGHRAREGGGVLSRAGPYDMWNTRYFIVPYFPGGWSDRFRGYASFLFESEQIYPPCRSIHRSQEG